MRSAIDPIKLLASRFASLPPLARMKVTEKLLRWREERQEAEGLEQRAASSACSRRKSFPEKFWDEVEAAHGDGLYPTNPFTSESERLLPLAPKETLRPCAA